jgi:2-keto-3-deoxy-6-phosphogluconate aldolase
VTVGASEILGRIAALRLLPVVELKEPDEANPLLDALFARGLPAAEITLRTEAGLAAIGELRRSHPHALVGAMTTPGDTSMATLARGQAARGGRPCPSPALGRRNGVAERAGAGEDRVRPELLLDAQELVVLGESLGLGQ